MKLRNSLKSYMYEITLNELYIMNHVEKWDISYNSLLYLDLIDMIPNCTGSDLSLKLGISKAAVSLKLNELMKQGLVTKRQSEKDRRIFYIEISPTCGVYYKQYEQALRNAMQNIKKNYSEKEIDIFCNILDDISDVYVSEMLHGK